MYDEYDENEQNDQNGPKDLRNALDKANKEKAALAKQVAEFTARLDQLEREKKSASLADLLKAKGVDPKYARWADKDEIEPSESAVDAWLADNKDLIPVTAESAGGSDESAPENQSAPTGDQGDPFAGMPEELQAVLKAMQSSQELESSASTSIPLDPRAEAAVERSLAAIGDSAKSEADLIKALTALGAPLTAGY